MYSEINVSSTLSLVQVSTSLLLASYPNYVFNSQVLSKPHANISLENGRLFLSDCGSSNGSYLNNVRLSSAGKKSNKVEIFSEDVIRCDTSKIENVFMV